VGCRHAFRSPFGTFGPKAKLRRLTSTGANRKECLLYSIILKAAVRERTRGGHHRDALAAFGPLEPRGRYRPRPGEGLQCHALVVDDVPVMRCFLLECLAHAGWGAVEAGGTEQALVLPTDGAFDLLVTDLLMAPGPDGLVLIREARARHPGLPAVLLSGSEAPKDLV
jgi:PleD family two-component response regulator